MCKRELQERALKKEKQLKEMKIDVKRKANNMSKMVQLFWKSVEKIVKHNYGVSYDKKKQQARAKKLENFVSKHLKLSVKVAEELNTKSFIQQSMYDKSKVLNDGGMVEEKEDENIKKTQVKIYESQDGFEEKKQVEEEDAQMTALAE